MPAPNSISTIMDNNSVKRRVNKQHEEYNPD
jgi:hypothetical protein